MEGDWLNEETVTAPTSERGIDEIKRRLLRVGASSLSNAELVSLLLDHDETKRGAELMSDGLRALMAEPPESLIEYRALSATESARVQAAAELARRVHDGTDDRPKLATPQAIYEWARKRFGAARKEEVHVLCMTSR
ncbi:MAG: hypothetical protein JNM17_38240, partial [Archangium sp.]|nr:hypothetical protein [Archangium sp.]